MYKYLNVVVTYQGSSIRAYCQVLHTLSKIETRAFNECFNNVSVWPYSLLELLELM